MDEFARIARLKRALATDAKAIRLGIGDDAAVIGIGGDAIVSTDASIEGVHFKRSFASLDRIAERAFHAAASDLAAMGATPICAFSSLTLPRDLSDEDFDLLVEGLRRAAASLFMPIAGGNLAAASEIGITLTVIGRAIHAPLVRHGAAVGDGIYVSGTLGGPALGLRALLGGESNPISPWFEVRARFDIAGKIATLASSCIDISDGLSSDLGHILEASGVGATLDASALPFPKGFEASCLRQGLDPVALALEGGEDYELCFTSAHDLSHIATRVGTIEAAPGLRLVRDSIVHEQAARGHRHFSD